MSTDPNNPYGYGPPPGSPAPGGNPPQQPMYGYPNQGYPGVPVQAPGTNVMAILSLVGAFVFWPAGIVLGHIARRQIKQSGEQGDGLAMAGMIISYIFGALTILGCGVLVIAAALSANS